MSSEELGLDPATLAKNAAQRDFYRAGRFELTDQDHHTIHQLNLAAGGLGLLNRDYWVKASRALSIPAEVTEGEKVNIVDFTKPDLEFHGILTGYSKVLAGRIVGINYVRAICLAFEGPTLLPYLESTPADHLLHVPVFAIDTIDTTTYPPVER